MKIFGVVLLVSAFLVTFSLQQEDTTVDPEKEESTTEGNGEEEEEEEEVLQSNDPNSIAFYLYPSAENDSYVEEIKIGESETLYNSSYSPDKAPVFLIHGFVNNYTCKFSQRVKNAFLEAGYGELYNVIVVDWGAMSSPKNQTNLLYQPLNDLAKNPHYQAAVRNVPKVGKRIKEFIIDYLMMENYLTSPEDVTLIGFSLGAQVAGSTGYEVNQNMTDPIGRITGLDPAGPLYKSQTNTALKLESSDASFVDIIHTNRGQSGYDGNIGHADFYPNGGGPNQNDCISVGSGSLQNNVAGICAHNRAWVYYISTMTKDYEACKCYATPDYWCRATCSNKVLFGYPTPPTARGVYYVDIVGKD